MSVISPVGSPHTHAAVSVTRTMGLVMLTLLPATAYGLWLFGWPAINTLMLSILGAVLGEVLCLWLAGRSPGFFLADGSALLSGWLLALTLPPWAPWWLALGGGLTAIVLGKQIYGGLGQNLFNPAMVGRVALLISFPVQMTQFVAPRPLFSADAPGLLDALAITLHGVPVNDGVTGATPLNYLKTELSRGLAIPDIPGHGLEDLFLGNAAGSLGETSAVLLLLGGLCLVGLRVIRWSVPLAMLGSLALLAASMHGLDPDRYPGVSYHLFSGAAMLGAFYIATDPVTSPVSTRGQLLFGVGCGVLTYAIRTWGNYPEGLGFAILLMNAATPLLDHYLRPRVYGRDGRGSPLRYRRPGP